jgi:hypothetical protein
LRHDGRGSHSPIDERLLDVGTPGELVFSPDGSMVAFALQATVADGGSHTLTSEVWMYDEMILQGEWNDPTSQYVERAPVTHAHRCRTPTLVIQGRGESTRRSGVGARQSDRRLRH